MPAAPVQSPLLVDRRVALRRAAQYGLPVIITTVVARRVEAQTSPTAGMCASVAPGTASCVPMETKVPLV